MRKPKKLVWKFERSKRGNPTTTKEKMEGLAAGLLIGALVVAGSFLIVNGLAKIEVE
ncbi:hypothetical protein [Stenotrophomonas sp. GD03657]|uniref:hypothetical protein n=1 Tax=Stenotrophomonas sp. GD03657 TaxID=2975363 RepID=UPI00244A872D|nr:hypothetical protein [Stenotrophomonas sp. GD03657]MDH2154033.1 hypothetical protein [Stenotrophomonas sp. GD03657]